MKKCFSWRVWCQLFKLGFCAMFIVTIILSAVLLTSAVYPVDVYVECPKEIVGVEEQKVAQDKEKVSSPIPVPSPSMTNNLDLEDGKATSAAIPHTEKDVYLLAQIIAAEMGGSWVDDKWQLYTGSVVLNRMKSPKFPDTLKGVIFQKGQYSPAKSGKISTIPDERTIENARTLLMNGSVLPDKVVFQAEFKQGSGVYEVYRDKVLGTTTYFSF